MLGNEATRREVSLSESTLEGVLLKMDRFDNCEKYMSKNQFEDEYLREVMRQRRPLKVKK